MLKQHSVLLWITATAEPCLFGEHIASAQSSQEEGSKHERNTQERSLWCSAHQVSFSTLCLQSGYLLLLRALPAPWSTFPTKLGLGKSKWKSGMKSNKKLWFPSVHKANQSPSPDTHPLTFLLLAWASPGAQTPSSSPQRTWALHLAALSTSFPEFIISFVFKSFIKFFFVTNLQGMEFHNCIVYYRRTYFSPCCPLCSLWILFLLFLPLLPSPWHWPFYTSCSDIFRAFSVIFSTGKS